MGRLYCAGDKSEHCISNLFKPEEVAGYLSIVFLFIPFPSKMLKTCPFSKSSFYSDSSMTSGPLFLRMTEFVSD